MNELLSRLQPYATLISAVASLAVLTFFVHLLNLIRNAFSEQVNAVKEQKGVTEARLRKAEEDLARTEKWHQRELDAVHQKLAAILGNENITIEQLVATGGQLHLSDEIKEAVNSVLREIAFLRESLSLQAEAPRQAPKVLLDMAKGFSAAESWRTAADFYGQYLESDPENWEVHFLRAVAYANSREGIEANQRALLALNSAIAYVPTGVDHNVRARLFGYRGANLKRLGRLEEAESDLLLARKWATARYELEDTAYNLAGVYAMMKRREEMFHYLRPLAVKASWRDYIQQRREYFSTYWDDPEFRTLVGLSA